MIYRCIIIFEKEFPSKFLILLPTIHKGLVWSVLVFYNQTSKIPSVSLSRLTTNICKYLVSAQEDRHLGIPGRVT